MSLFWNFLKTRNSYELYDQCVSEQEILTGTGNKAGTKSMTGPGPRPGPEIRRYRDRDQGPGPGLIWDRDCFRLGLRRNYIPYVTTQPSLTLSTCSSCWLHGLILVQDVSEWWCWLVTGRIKCKFHKMHYLYWLLNNPGKIRHDWALLDPRHHYSWPCQVGNYSRSWNYSLFYSSL